MKAERDGELEQEGLGVIVPGPYMSSTEGLGVTVGVPEGAGDSVKPPPLPSEGEGVPLAAPASVLENSWNVEVIVELSERVLDARAEAVPIGTDGETASNVLSEGETEMGRVPVAVTLTVVESDADTVGVKECDTVAV